MNERTIRQPGLPSERKYIHGGVDASQETNRRFRFILAVLIGMAGFQGSYLALRIGHGVTTYYDLLSICLLGLCLALTASGLSKCLNMVTLSAINRMRNPALHDELTGIFGRRYTLCRLDQEIAEAERYARPLSVIYMDLDHFKAVNDRHGRRIGDAVLREAVGVLQDAVRQVDHLGRIGGDDFLAILPSTDVKGAETVKRRCQEGIARLRDRELEGVCLAQLRLSAGVAQYTGEAETAEQLILRADRAMQEDKGARRPGGRTVVMPCARDVAATS